MTRRFVPLVASVVLIVLAIEPAVRAQTTPPAAQPPAPPSPQAAPAAPAPEQPTLADDRNAIEVGKTWLGLIDAGKADAAWDAASKQLQSVVKRDKFVVEMRRSRKPLGKVVSRTPTKFARAHELPGAPAGDYVIIEYDAEFANGKHLTEQLVWTAVVGDNWRVAGYYYR
jgi:Protein of unknown function (DUF4019)